MEHQIHLELKLRATPEVIYDAWLNGNKHGAFINGDAHFEPVVGSRFSAWEDYITGEILELDLNQRIFQSWRTTEFPEDAANSFLEILFSTHKKGCKLTLNQWNIPEDQVAQYAKGWAEHHFESMMDYFS